MLPYFVRRDVFETRTGRPPEGIPPFSGSCLCRDRNGRRAIPWRHVNNPLRGSTVRDGELSSGLRLTNGALQATDQPECEE